MTDKMTDWLNFLNCMTLLYWSVVSSLSNISLSAILWGGGAYTNYSFQK